jgi:hypothetical protein
MGHVPSFSEVPQSAAARGTLRGALLILVTLVLVALAFWLTGMGADGPIVYG